MTDTNVSLFLYIIKKIQPDTSMTDTGVPLFFDTSMTDTSVSLFLYIIKKLQPEKKN